VKRAFMTLMAAFALPTHAQTQQAAHTGARVRFIVVDTINAATNDLKYSYPEGIVVGSDGGRLLLRSELSTAADTVRVPLSNIASAEQFAGRKHRTWQVALGGMVAGGALGFITGNSGREKRNCHNTGLGLVCTTTVIGDQRMKNLALGAGAGAVVGGVIGFSVRVDNWRRINPAELRSF